MIPLEFHLESRPCPKCGAAMLHDQGEPWDGPTWGCTGCGHSENAVIPADPDDALADARAQIENLRAALQWYADGLHFDKASPDAWDTVSGEPQNWWCDEAGTATVEDGSIAAMVLRGELTGAQIQALE